MDALSYPKHNTDEDKQYVSVSGIQPIKVVTKISGNIKTAKAQERHA